MYRDMLRTAIDTIGITQGQLAEECKKLNAPISRGQINKIIAGKAKPPEEEVTRAFAKICELDEREFVIEGYLEKAPKEFINFLNKLQDIAFSYSIKLFETDFLQYEDILRDEYKKTTLTKLIVEILDIDKSVKDYESIFDTRRVGKDIEIIEKEKPYVLMEDDSMEEKIPKGSKLRLKVMDKYRNGDIVLVETKGKRLIRMLFNIGRDICLHAMNRNYTSLYLNNGDYKIVAKIESVEIKL